MGRNTHWNVSVADIFASQDAGGASTSVLQEDSGWEVVEMELDLSKCAPAKLWENPPVKWDEYGWIPSP